MALCHRLSPRTVYERFFSFRRLLPEEAHALANVDYRQRMALVAEVTDGQEPELIGVARYGPGDEVTTAEIGLVVEDGWQGLGLGSILLEEILRAGEQRGIHQFSADVLTESGRALAVPGSVTDEADVQHAVQATLATFGRVDVLVNNAGSLLHAGPLHETADAIWDGVMDVFLKGVFRFSRAVIPHMQRQGGGSIVNIGSVLGLKASQAFPVHAYAVAKAGVAMLTKTIAAHYAKDGIRCNCVAPALTETPLTESRLRDAAARTTMEAQYPLGRLGRPDDVAQAALYLASDDAAWTTGTVLTVDGGIMA